MGSSSSSSPSPSSPLSSSHKPLHPPSQDFEYFKANFLLTDSDIFKLLSVFQHFDSSSNGYLTIDNFIQFIISDNYTLILPCIIHLFRLIAKQDSDRIYFEQWLGSMISFCLYNKQALFRFTFEMIDTDYDEKVTYQDISYYLGFEDPKTGVKVFPITFISSFEQSREVGEREVFFEEFRKMNQNFKFLCWPAQNLQENLRNKLLGNVFWERLNERIEEEQSKLKKMSNKDRLDQEKKKMKEQKFKKMFEGERRENESSEGNGGGGGHGKKRWKERLGERRLGEVGSDTLLSFKKVREAHGEKVIGEKKNGNVNDKKKFRRKSLAD